LGYATYGCYPNNALCTIGNAGCFLTSLTNLAAYWGESLDPGQMDDKLLSVGGFAYNTAELDPTGWNWAKKDLGNLDNNPDQLNQSWGRIQPQITGVINKGEPFVIGWSGDGHYVLAYGYRNGAATPSDVEVVDPGYPNAHTLQDSLSDSGYAVGNIDFWVYYGYHNGSNGPDQVIYPAPTSNPLMSIDSPASQGAGNTAAGNVTVSGWAIDQASTSGSGIDKVDLYLDGYSGQGGIGLTEVTNFSQRPDVAKAYGPQFLNSEFSATIDMNGYANGQHTFYVYEHSALSNNWTVQTRTFVLGNAAGSLDSPTGQTVAGNVPVRGWACDPNSSSGTGIDMVDVYVDGLSGQGGTFVTRLTNFKDRQDVVDAGFGQHCLTSGFDTTLDVTGWANGLHTLYMYAHSVQYGWSWHFNSQQFAVDNAIGNLEHPNQETVASNLPISGWVCDPASSNGTGIDMVDIYVDGPAGQGGTAMTRITSFSDRQYVVDAGNGQHCLTSGFSTTVDVSGYPNGVHTLYMYAHSVQYGWSWHFDSRTFTLDQALGNLDSPTGQTVTDTVAISGWACDSNSPSGTGIDKVDIYVDGLSGQGGTFVTSLTNFNDRTDVAAAYGQRCLNSGFSTTVDVKGWADGPHKLYMYAHSPQYGWSWHFNTQTFTHTSPAAPTEAPTSLTGTSTPTTTSIPTSTPTSTSVPSEATPHPSASATMPTSTATPMPTATLTPASIATTVPTSSPTNTSVPTVAATMTEISTATATSTAIPTATQTAVPTATATNSAVSTSTATPVPPTTTATPVPPSATNTPPASFTPSATPVPPTATNTPTLPAVATATSTAPASTATSVPATAASVPVPASAPTTSPAPASPATATSAPGGSAPTGVSTPTSVPATSVPATTTPLRGASPLALPTDAPAPLSPGRGTPQPRSATPTAVATSHPSISVTALLLPSARALSVSIRTAANAHVTVTLQVFGRRTVLVGKGKHRGRMVRKVVLYAVTMRGTTGRQGRLTGRLPITYRPARPVQAALSVAVRGKDSSATARMSVLLKPHR